VEILLTHECSFRGEDFLNFRQPETIIAHGDHYLRNQNGMKKSLRFFHRCFLLNFAKWFQGRRFLEIDQPETDIGYGGHVC